MSPFLIPIVLVPAFPAAVDGAGSGIEGDAEVVNDRSAASAQNKTDARSDLRGDAGDDGLVFVDERSVVGDDKLAARDDKSTIDNDRLVAEIGRRMDVDDGSDA